MYGCTVCRQATAGLDSVLLSIYPIDEQPPLILMSSPPCPLAYRGPRPASMGMGGAPRLRGYLVTL